MTTFYIIYLTLGSSEIMALDLSNLPVGDSLSGNHHHSIPMSEWPGLVTAYKHRDNKLRGFSTATVVSKPFHNINSNNDATLPPPPTSESNSTEEYRIICGLGIKNLHVWRFITKLDSDTTSSDKDIMDVNDNNSDNSTTNDKDLITNDSKLNNSICFSDSNNTTNLSTSTIIGEWSHIYDIVTNGISVLCAGFRQGGHEVMSKSDGANIRVSFTFIFFYYFSIYRIYIYLCVLIANISLYISHMIYIYVFVL